MKLVILDALTLGQDVDLNRFNKYGEMSVYQTTNQDELLSRIIDADMVISNKVIIDEKTIEQTKKLKLICVAATGYNNIDIMAASRKEIVVANVRNYSTEGVAQHTFSLILALENSLIDYINDTRNGLWEKSPVFTMINHPFTELKGKNLGIIGYGTIGKRVAEIARAFGMNILIGKRKGVEYEGHERVDLEFLLKESDIVSIHAPLSENTRNLITKHELGMMKPSAILINVARGGIVNEKDLYQALVNGTIRGAAIDVCDTEPMKNDNPIAKLKNILITPHIAWASYQSRLRLLEGIEQNILKFIAGKGAEIDLAI